MAKRFRTVGEMLTDRAIQIRNDQSYRMRLALRDSPDYSNTPESVSEPYIGQEKEKQEVIHRHSNMSRQEFTKLQDLIGQVAYLQNKIEELSKPREKKPDSKYGYRGIR